MDIIDKLQALYADESKHSVYQNTPQFIREKLGYTEIIDENWRGDSARWDYLSQAFDFSGQTILDVGANTGFFALSIAHRTPEAEVTALEGNENHSRYIETIADHFKMPNMYVLHQYLGMEDLPSLGQYDTVLLFNVLHHAGVDFDKTYMEDKTGLSGYCTDYMKKLALKCSRVVFQMGYNWGGNKQHPVVQLDDDIGKVTYTAQFMYEAGWEIEKVFLPRICDGKAYPAELTAMPTEAILSLNKNEPEHVQDLIGACLDPHTDQLSEFYRRPLFVCKTK